MASSQYLRGHSAITIDIVIVGGGIAGLAAAICLGRSGHRITVIEQNALLLEDEGAGIQITPNASRLLIRWGLQACLDEVGVKPVSASFNRYANDEEIGFTYIGDHFEAEYGSPYYHVHRADFLRMLHSLAQHYATFKQGTVVEVVSGSVSSLPRVLLETGEQIAADIIIGADGVKSIVRRCVVDGPDRAILTGDMAYRAVIPAEKLKGDRDLSSLFDKPQSMFWMGPGRHIVGYFMRNRTLYNLVMIRPDDGPESGTALAQKDEVVESFRGWTRRVERLAGLVEDVKKLKVVALPPMRTWIDNNGRVVLLGDSCHAMLPYLAQGAAMAIEDAAVLGRLFSHLSDVSQITPLLRAYEAIRLPRAAATQKASQANQGRFHIPDGPLQRNRDAAMKAARQATLQADPAAPTTNRSIFFGHDKSLEARQFGYDAEADADRWLREHLSYSSQSRL